MIDISLKKYMIIDLIILTVIGTIIELIAMYIIPRSVPYLVPTFCISITIILVAIARWGWQGLILVPVMALICWGSGSIVGRPNESYDWRMFLSNLIGFFSTALVLPFRKKGKAKAIFWDIPTTILQSSLVLICFILLQSIMWIVCGEDMNILESVGFTTVSASFGILATYLVIFILRHQNITNDVKRSILDAKKEQELERKYYSQYSNQVIIKETHSDKDILSEDKEEK